MTFQELFQAFVAKLKDAQKKLPLADQFEANSIFNYGIIRMKECVEEADTLFASLAPAMAEAANAAKTEGITEGKTAAMAEIAATHVPKTEHEQAVQAAAEEAAKQAKIAAKQDFEAATAASAERMKIATELSLPAEAVAKLPDAALAPATAEATRAKLAERAGKLNALGFTPADHGDLYSAAAESLDEAGDKTFDALVARMKSAQEVGKKAAGANAEAAGRKTGGAAALLDAAAQGNADAAKTEKPALIMG